MDAAGSSGLCDAMRDDNYILVDVGANLMKKKFSRDVECVIERAKEAGVKKIIVPGTSVKSSKEAVRLCKFHHGTMYATAGVHPYEAKSWDEGTEEELRELLAQEECVAVGQCGLDYTKDFSPPDIQRDVFEKQVTLACCLNKPLYVHEKGALEDTVKILAKYKDRLPTIVLHSFSGNMAEVKSYMDLHADTYIAIAGSICKDNADSGLQKMIENGSLPLGKILLETDSPFSYPNARSTKLPSHVKDAFTEKSLKFLQRYCTFQRTEPCGLPIIVEMLAGLLKKPAGEVALMTTFNALKAFGINC